ncbi:MAG: hypothetical protein LAQ30_03430 [Acidobacteriia bacterium]|nr:hypothetical protein [Terriglobia bacterium]
MRRPYRWSGLPACHPGFHAGTKAGMAGQRPTPPHALRPGILWIAALLASAAFAQNAPHLAYVFPAGGQRGTTLQIRIGGQFLNQVTGARISGGGVRAETTAYARPMNNMKAMQLRERMQALQKTPNDPAARQEMAEIRHKLATFNRAINPVLAEVETLTLTIAPDAQPGRRELRLSTPQGLSNPLVFCVGQLAEFGEKQSDVRLLVAGMTFEETGIEREMAVTLPVTINGRIMPRPARPQNQLFTPGEADRYRFQAHKDEQLVIAASARDLIPYLADAVPGWFQPTVALFDDKGHELAYDDDYRFHPDPVVHYQIPRDGEYVVEIKDALYRGREDFVYRLTIGDLPFVTTVFPLGGRAGARTTVAVEGWNLPARKVVMESKGKEPGVYPLPLNRAELESNPALFAVDTMPEIVEKEPNDAPRGAQRVKLPVIVNGRIGRPGDSDVFAFQGRKGETVVAEVYARRLESPVDSALRLTDAAGRQLAFNDDHEDRGYGLLTHQADSFLSVTLPANGTYYLYLTDAQGSGGPEYVYRLRISPPRPDFELRVTPSAINAGRGLTVPVAVHAIRKDGFPGEIALALKDAPRGLSLSGGLIPAGQDQVRVTLTVPPATPLAEALALSIEGRAKIQGRDVAHAALPADDMMQAFAYRHLVGAEALTLTVARRGALRMPARILGGEPLKIPAGGSVRLRVQAQLPPNGAIAKLRFELSDPPEGIALKDTVPAGDGVEIVLQCDAAKAKPGMKGNLIVNVLGEREVTVAGTGRRNTQRVQLGALPAAPFEIVSR